LRLIATQILAENGSVKRCVSSPEMPMKKTSARFVLVIFGSILASSTLTAAPDEEKPADTCLLGPSASTPPRGHWYFRVDRVNKRNCWYLGQEKEKAGRKAAAADAVPTEKPAPAPKKPVAQRSLTDAHAELPLPQTSAEQDTKAAAAQWAPMADAQRADTAQTVVTTRWPEPAAVSPSAPPPPAPVARVAETQFQAQTPAAPVTPPPRPAASPAQPAKATAAPDKPLSLPMLLTVLAGGLSVIGVMASAIFARGKSRRGKSRSGRRLSQSAPMPPLQAPEKPLPEEQRGPDDPTRRLQQMLAEIQKRAAA
jgi:hypothetical protein